MTGRSVTTGDPVLAELMAGFHAAHAEWQRLNAITCDKEAEYFALAKGVRRSGRKAALRHSTGLEAAVAAEKAADEVVRGFEERIRDHAPTTFAALVDKARLFGTEAWGAVDREEDAETLIRDLLELGKKWGTEGGAS